jgi:hypothetical protein
MKKFVNARFASVRKEARVVVLAVLIPLEVLLNFKITYSPPLGVIKGLSIAIRG